MASSFETTLFPIVQTINEYLSNYVLVILLLGIGIWYTIKTRCVQVRCFKEGWNRVFGNITLNGKKGGDGMSSFQALATAIAAQVGTGIIVGVAGAILTGGPGAVFWMWVISFFGMATIYAEATLAQETRIVEPDGTIKGGPVYYITTAFKGGLGKFLAAEIGIAHFGQHKIQRFVGGHGGGSCGVSIHHRHKKILLYVGQHQATARLILDHCRAGMVKIL